MKILSNAVTDSTAAIMHALACNLYKLSKKKRKYPSRQGAPAYTASRVITMQVATHYDHELKYIPMLADAGVVRYATEKDGIEVAPWLIPLTPKEYNTETARLIRTWNK